MGRICQILRNRVLGGASARFPQRISSSRSSGIRGFRRAALTMRGLLSILTTDRTIGPTGIFVASSDPEVTAVAIVAVHEMFPDVAFSVLAPESYRTSLPFPPNSEHIPLEQVKAKFFRILELRARQFDISV